MRTELIERKNNTTLLRVGDEFKQPAPLKKEVAANVTNAVFEKVNTIMCNDDKVMSMINAQQAEFFARQLSYFYPSLLIKKYADLKFRQFCPIVRGEAYDQLNITQMYDVVGEVTPAGQMSGNLGVVDVLGNEQIDKIIDLQTFIKWTYSEMQADLTWNKIKPAKFFAMQRAFEQKLNSVFYFGDASLKLNGVLVDPTIPTYAAPATGTGSSTLWANKTPAQRLADLVFLLNNLNTLAQGRFAVRKIVMSLNIFNSTFGTPRSDYVDTSVFKYIIEQFPLLESIEGDAVLNGAGPSGTGVAIAFDNETPDNYYMNIPLEMLPLPLFQEGTLMKFPFLTRTTGLIVPYSNSVNVMTGL